VTAITLELFRGRLNGDCRLLFVEEKRQKRDANQSQYSTEDKNAQNFMSAFLIRLHSVMLRYKGRLDYDYNIK
jgi:hypothetical protein